MPEEGILSGTGPHPHPPPAGYYRWVVGGGVGRCRKNPPAAAFQTVSHIQKDDSKGKGTHRRTRASLAEFAVPASPPLPPAPLVTLRLCAGNAPPCHEGAAGSVS
ncbi:hypothetical protein NTCA1_18050 [Novosphingobium sp. TCA1]|nr:hypothetical protein NTCA1_18050 [Novosphingobium sp. TCA1]